MSIFGNDKGKNKVYYRRKSIRQSNIALGISYFSILAYGIYYLVNRETE